MEAKKDNVIHFPNRKKEVDDSTPVTQPSQPKKSWAIYTSLAGIFVVTLLSNRFVGTEGSTDLASTVGGRGIASVNDHALIAEERDSSWEKSLARQIQGSARRDIASLKLGHLPTIEEELRFGVLKGQYTLNFENGKVHSARLPSGQSEAQIYLGDSREFLQKQKAILPVDFTTLSQVHKTTDANGSMEIVAMQDHTGQKIGEARFEYDQYGHLREFNVRASTSVGQ